GGAEEDGWVAEHLPQPEVAEAGGDVPVEGAQEERGEPVGLAQDVTGGEVAPRGEARVEEPAQGDVVGAARGGEVGPQPVAGAGFDALEGGDVGLLVGGDVERVGPALEEHPVAGVEGDEVQRILRGGAEQPEEPVEDLGHEVPGGAGVEAEPRGAPAAGPSAELRPPLDRK